MASRNGQSVYDILSEGWSRKVSDRNGAGSLVVTIPVEFHEEHGIEPGDTVAMIPSETEPGVLELHFG